MGYEELDFFLDSLDGEINSHLIIKAIFKNNEVLMRRVPHTLLASLVDRIIKNGKSHHYLTLFAAITNVGERNIVENQYEIVKSLTSPGRLQKVACFFVPVDHPDYAEKRKLMEDFLDVNRDLSLDDLPPLLAYHLMFLEVLSGCTVGRMDLRTVEAKVQSVYSYGDILQSILDPVELKIPGLDQSPEIWKLLESYKSILSTAKEDIQKIERQGWQGGGGSGGSSRQKIEYIIVSIDVIRGFFQHYYQAAVFQTDDQESKGQSKGQFSLTHVDDIIIYFFTKIKDIYDLNPTRLSETTKKDIYETLNVLNHKISGGNPIVLNIKLPQQKGEGDDNEADHSTGLEMIEDPEKLLISKYRSFLEILEKDTTIQYEAENENVAFIRILEALPFIADPSDADVRYETLIKKLVYHIRENITIVNNQKRLDGRVTKTSIWIIRAFRTMIENRMGMSIYERDDDGGQEQDLAAAPVVNALNTCGATALCLDLIADGIDEKLQLEAIRLGVGLLFKEGGALEVQTLMNTHLRKTNSELFFKQVRLTLQKLKAWHEWNQIIVLEEDEEPKPPEEILIVRFLQLMCEGHYLPNQDIMREQPNNAVSYNILDDLVLYLNCLSRFPCRTSTNSAIRVAATILEVIQGPCEGNQVHFALNTELIETLNRLNRAKMSEDSVEEEEVELKKTSIDIFQGLLEGQEYEEAEPQGEASGFSAFTGLSLAAAEPKDSEEKEILQTECVVLLQMLCNFKPSLYDELGISKNIEDIVGSGTAMIEVIWRGDIHRRFFHVPNICAFLAKSSKDALVENVDRSNAENKLIDFLERAKTLYREVKHQQLLTEMNLSQIFSRGNQNRATWIAFILGASINVLLLFSYTTDNGYDPRLPHSIAFAIPVKFQSLEAAGHSPSRTILLTAIEPMTINFYDCFKVTLGYGLQMDGGVGDIFNVTVHNRFYLDISYFLIVNIGMLNLIGGVIITTFGQLRENKAARVEDTEGVCFICNIDKQIFDRASDEPDGFRTHVKIDHNMWNYLYFIFMLWEQDRDDDDGLEQYVRRAIEANEITWFPMHKAIRLNQAATKEESLLNDLVNKSKSSETNIANKLDKFQTDINTVLEQLNQALKGDHIMDRQEVSRGMSAALPPALMAFGGQKGFPLPTLQSSDSGLSDQNIRIGNKKTMKILNVKLRELSWKEDEGLRASDHENIYCNIYFENNLFTVKALPGGQGKDRLLRFREDEAVGLVEGVVPDDERVVLFQIMRQGEEGEEDEELALFESTVDDLFMAEGCYVDLFYEGEEPSVVSRLSVTSVITVEGV
eukprot:scaffold572_cov163-Ochromonas_danica.AAC.10